MINFEEIKNIKKINDDTKGKEPRMLSPAQLAYVGDAVFEILVRTYLVDKYNYNVNVLHKRAIKFVKAEAQADLLKKLDCELTEEEKKIVKRGRNAKITSVPKNAAMIDYRYATAFEALLGYLFLKNDYDRLSKLFDRIIEIKETVGDTNENNRG